MDSKGLEKGILKVEPRQRSAVDSKLELTPQGSYDRPPASPQPSVDRLSVTWADPGSMTSSGVNLFHMPSEISTNNEVKFSPATGDGSEDEDYSASFSAVLRQRRASVRRSRKGRARRPSSPLQADELRSRRRSSVFTTSSGDTAISIDDQPTVTQEQIFENIHLHKEVLGSVKQQPLGMRRKLKIVNQAKAYIKRHEGQLQERLAQSKSTKDIYARFNILLATKWQQLKREAANTSNLLIPWELRIKEIESHFGSVVASYFTFLRWLFWVNLVIGFILLVFVIIPEYLTANPLQDGERKIIMEEERQNATNLLTLWEFEGILKYSAIFYGFYSNVERPEYRMPLAYFLTGVVVYIYSFVAILRKMAENSRMSKLSEKEDECIFSWKLFTGWDYMIGNAETAHNRIASVILGFKEALLEEAEKKKNLRNWRIISLRALVNLCVVILLGVSAYAVVTVVSRSDDYPKIRSLWRENETTTVVTVISITFPVFFELLGLFEHFHPRKQLRLQLARIMLLNLLNLYSLIFALFSKIEGMSKELVSLQPNITMNVTIVTDSTMNINEPLEISLHRTCFETTVPCLPCDMVNFPNQIIEAKLSRTDNKPQEVKNIKDNFGTTNNIKNEATVSKRNSRYALMAENLTKNNTNDTYEDTAFLEQIELIKNLSLQTTSDDLNETSEIDYNEPYDINDALVNSANTSASKQTQDYNEIGFTKSFTPRSTPVPEIKTTVQTLYTPTLFSANSLDEQGMDSKTTQSTTLNIDSSTSYFVTSTSLDTIKIINEDDENNSFESTERSTINIFNETLLNKASSLDPFYRTTEISHFDSTAEQTEIPSTKYVLNHFENVTVCPDLSFNCSIQCGDKNITQTFYMSNCTIVDIKCYIRQCKSIKNLYSDNLSKNQTNNTLIDIVYTDSCHRKMYNLTVATRKKLLKLCWETMFGQELVKLTMMDLVFVLLGTLFMDFFRALFLRYMNRCWCWDLEKKFPKYGDFKIAENILHLINNQGMVWMGMFFSPGLVVLNIFKLMIMMYLRSWAVMTCNVPHEVVFRVSKSNNFYLGLLLTMLFLCVLPVGYTIVWVTPSWHCGPFSEYDKIYKILTNNIYKVLPKSLNFALEYMASPAIVIPLLVLLVLIIYYLTSLTNSLREANNDLKIQLRRERTEERRKMFQLADTRRRGGSSSIDNTPFARWKKAFPTLPQTKSIDSNDRKTSVNDIKESVKAIKKKGNIFAKIVGLAVDKKSNNEVVQIPSSTNHIDEETDTDFHESLPKEILKIKDITFITESKVKKKTIVDFDTEDIMVSNLYKNNPRSEEKIMTDSIESDNLRQEKIRQNPDIKDATDSTTDNNKVQKNKNSNDKSIKKKQSSDSSNLSKQNDSIGSVIPVITISTTESDDEILQTQSDNTEKKITDSEKNENSNEEKIKNEIKKSRSNLKRNKNCSDLKSLQRQSSVDSINENKSPKENKPEDTGHKYQYSL